MWGTSREIAVWVPPELSHTGAGRWKRVGVDACIADIVSALQVAGITTTGCCCGHGSGRGEIGLRDGRTLVIEEAAE